jgi:hypothetical protein
MTRRFTEEERQTIWDMQEAGVKAHREASRSAERLAPEVHRRSRGSASNAQAAL